MGIDRVFACFWIILRSLTTTVRVGVWRIRCRKCFFWWSAARSGGCDDFDAIVEWGEDNLPFLRRFLPFHHGVPGSRWLRVLLNRIDPVLFDEMFRSWAATIWPNAPDLVAIDGKTSRGSPDRGNGRAALHLISAFATREKLVLAQEAVAPGGCEQTTIPLLLERLADNGQRPA